MPSCVKGVSHLIGTFAASPLDAEDGQNKKEKPSYHGLRVVKGGDVRMNECY
jgi:hypothetical protein